MAKIKTNTPTITVEQTQPLYNANDLKEGDVIIADCGLLFYGADRYQPGLVLPKRFIKFYVDKVRDKLITLRTFTDYPSLYSLWEKPEEIITAEMCGWVIHKYSRLMNMYYQIFEKDDISKYIVSVDKAPEPVIVPTPSHELGSYDNPVIIGTYERPNDVHITYHVNNDTRRCIVEYKTLSFSERLESLWCSFKELFFSEKSLYISDI